jgi:hypothetical protein
MTLPTDDPLEATACWAAAVRAREITRPDRLFADPRAAALAGPEGAAWLGRQSADGARPWLASTAPTSERRSQRPASHSS